MAAASKAKTGVSNKRRLAEILGILRRHELTKGFTPEKLRLILEDLGPTYIKLGQIMSMRTDMIPPAFCAELSKLRTDVAPMPFEDVCAVIEESCGSRLELLFSEFEQTPLGSASIAQAHRAVLMEGDHVVVKVQRRGIREVMVQDIALLRRAARLLRLAPDVANVIDLNMVLDELWSVAQEEMNFLIEASNAEDFYRLNDEIVYVSCPHIYHNLTTARVLVMEEIEGYDINDLSALHANGYDLEEIGTKLADNYIKQIIDDGFFHADPHPGNIKIRDGKIVWIDMGMMGRLSARDQKLISAALTAVATHDVGTLKEVVLTLGVCKGPINHAQLYTDIDDMLTRYGSMDLGNMDLAEVIQELLDMASVHKIGMPSGVSMLGRGVTTIEGVLEEISPDINLVQVAATRLSNTYFRNFDWKKFGRDTSRTLVESSRKSMEIPALAADLLKMSVKGQTKVNLDINSTEELKRTANILADKIVMGLLVAAMFVGSSLLCTTNMKPQLFGIPALGVLGYVGAIVLGAWMFFRENPTKRR